MFFETTTIKVVHCQWHTVLFNCNCNFGWFVFFLEMSKMSTWLRTFVVNMKLIFLPVFIVMLFSAFTFLNNYLYQVLHVSVLASFTVIHHCIIITSHPLFVSLLNLKTSYYSCCFQYDKWWKAGWGLGTRLDPPTCFTGVHTEVRWYIHELSIQVCLNALFSYLCRLYWKPGYQVLNCITYLTLNG